MLTEARRQLAHAIALRVETRVGSSPVHEMCAQRGFAFLGATGGRDRTDGRVWFRLQAEDAHGAFRLSYRIERDGRVTAFVDETPLLQPEVWS